jgi:ADP-ribose pyrophosphatase
MTTPAKFDLLNSETIYTGRVFSLQRDAVRLPDGKTARLDILRHPGAATIVPVDDARRVWFVQQYRHAAGRVLLELPAGTLNAGEAPEVCAAREVREEIGMAAGKLEYLGGFFNAPGYSTEFLHIYLATDLRPDPSPHDDDEFLEIEKIPIAMAMAMASDGRIVDAKSIAALMLTRGKLPAK